MKIEDVIYEWFANLPFGYALPPYDKEEISALREVIEEHGLDESIIKVLTEEESEEETAKQQPKQQPQEPTEEPEQHPEPERPDTRFRGETADFMANPTELGNFIVSKYTDGSVRIEGFRELFGQIKKLPSNRLQNVTKLIYENTNRKISGGSFKMGDNERLLRSILNKNLRFDNSTSDDLFVAIIYNGQIKGAPKRDTGIYSTIDIDGSAGIKLRRFKNLKSIDFGVLPPETSELLDGIISVYRLVNNKDISGTVTSFEINEALKLIQKPEIASEIETLLQSQQTSSIKAIKILGQRINTMLDATPIGEIASRFIKSVDGVLRNKLQSVSHWVTVGKRMVFIETSVDIYNLVKPNDRENTLSTSILNLKDKRIIVNAQSIHKALVEQVSTNNDTTLQFSESEQKEIILEWFARLPKGVAQYPYSKEELSILSDVLKERLGSNSPKS